MKLVDLVLVTGSRRNVKLGYSSGTPALGVGVGNVVSIIDETASLVDAAKKISSSKIFGIKLNFSDFIAKLWAVSGSNLKIKDLKFENII